MGGSPASPTSRAVPRLRFLGVRGSPSARAGLPWAPATWFPLAALTAAAQHLPSHPGSALGRHGGARIFGAGGFEASLPEEAAGWQGVLVWCRGSQAAGPLLLCLTVSPMGAVCPSSSCGRCSVQTLFFPDFIWVDSTRLLVF